MDTNSCACTAVCRCRGRQMSQHLLGPSLRSLVPAVLVAVVCKSALALTGAVPVVDAANAGAEKVDAGKPGLSPPLVDGVYDGAEGAKLTILPAGRNSFKVVYRRTPSAIEWEGLGFFSPECKCMRVVYSYTNNTGQNRGIGTLHLEVGESGKLTVPRSGWGVSQSGIRPIDKLTKSPNR